MKPYLDPVWGDRRQEIVFIGIDPMDQALITRRLNDCLEGKVDQFTPEAWRGLPDPFPSWTKYAA
jgi:hypothetical protein